MTDSCRLLLKVFAKAIRQNKKAGVRIMNLFKVNDYTVDGDAFLKTLDSLHVSAKQNNLIKFFLNCISDAKTAGHMIQYTIKDTYEYKFFGIDIIDLRFNDYVDECQKVVEFCNSFAKDNVYFGTRFKNIFISLISENNQVKRLNITFGNYTPMCYFDYDMKQSCIRFSGRYAKNVVMYDNLYPLRIDSIRVYPMNIKEIFKIFIGNKVDDSKQFDILKTWLDYFSEKSLIYKDIIQDYLNGITIMPPMSLDALNNIHNKTEFIQAKIKNANCTSRDSRVPLTQSYYIHKALPYIKDTRFIQKLYDLPIDTVCDDMSNRETRRPKDVIRNYYRYVCRDRKSDDFTMMIDDYMRMADQLNEKFDLRFDSFSRIRREHDAMMKRVQSMSIPEFKIPNTTLSKLKLPKQYVRIENKEDLIEEGMRQEHCVAMYAESIRRGRCLIYTTVYHSKRYTLEIRMSGNKYVLAQFRGKFNSDVPTELEQEVQSCLLEQNEKLRKK